MQAAQRIVLGTLSGLAALEEQVSELFTGMVSCSKFLLIGYRASEKAMYIRGGLVPAGGLNPSP